MYRPFSLLLTMPLLTGCAPVWETYYRPSSLEAIEVRKCNAPVKEIAIEAGTGRLSFVAYNYRAKPGFVFFAFSFEPDWVWEESGIFSRRIKWKAEKSILSIKPNEVEVLLADSETKTKPTLVGASIFDYRTQQETQLPLLGTLELPAQTTKSYRMKNVSTSIISMLKYEVQIGDQKEFTVFIPDFHVDGVKQKGRAIHFSESWSIWITPLNGC
jgi:hypothetical protein